MNTFEVGDIVTEKTENPRGKGQVLSIDSDGFTEVRFMGGEVFWFWPQELVFVGKLDPTYLPALKEIDKTISAAQSTIYKLKDIRKGLMTLAMERLETDG